VRATDVFLLMLEAAGGTIKGKTLVHKRGFFLNKLVNLDLKYKPHYYGPYSPELEEAIGTCKALGLVEQRVVNYGPSVRGGFEVRRFDYSITENGKKVIDTLKKRMPQKSEEIIMWVQKIAGHDLDDYVTLSLAAKAMFVLEEKDKPMNFEDIVKEAKRYNWNINPDAVEKAAKFLEELGLVRQNHNDSF